MFWGKIIGLVAGVSLSYFFLLPNDFFHNGFVEMPVEQTLRIAGAVAVTITTLVVGHFLDDR